MGRFWCVYVFTTRLSCRCYIFAHLDIYLFHPTTLVKKGVDVDTTLIHLSLDSEKNDILTLILLKFFCALGIKGFCSRSAGN